MINEPGIYNINEAEYHADPCPEPSLSASIARKLIRQSPLHAWHKHPRLNPDRSHDDSGDAADAGTILHKMLLGKGADIAPIDAADWRTKAAKDARDAARAAGLTPVLTHKLAELHDCAAAARKQLLAHPDGSILFEPGQPERAMIWREGSAWCRSLVDWMPDDPALPLVDLKTTGLSAAPGEWDRRLVSEYALQDAFYRSGARALGRTSRAPMLFIVIEQTAPYGVAVMCAAPSLQAIAEYEVEKAVTLWQRCMSTNEWPGYPAQTMHVEAPNWMINKHEYEMMEAA